MNFKQALSHFAKQAGGSYKTVHDRQRIMQRFVEYLKQHNIQIKHTDHIKTKHIEGYIKSRLTQGITRRTLQNEMSAIRVTLTQAGREKLAQSERLTNQALNIHNASRAGTKTSITEQQYQQIFQLALQKDQGLAATIQLARALGLRSEEAVQSIHSLKTWQTALNQGKTTLPIIFGTKGGRPRETRIINPERVKQAVNFAIKVSKQQNGKLINKPNLKQAMTYWRNQTRAIGLTGTIAPHSLRYAWAQDAIQYYKEQGYSDKEALAMTSMDLGHGDGRGRYVKRIYNLKENSINFLY